MLLPALLLAVACNGGTKDAASQSSVAEPPTVPAPKPRSSPAPDTSAAPDLAAVHVTFTTVASGLKKPTDVLWRRGDARMYVVEQGGNVRIIDQSGQVSGTPVLTLPVAGGPEQGLFSATFSPDGTKLYVEYDDSSGDLHVDEFTMAGDLATAGRTLIQQHEPYPNHNGDALVFGPDGMLYVGLGDGGSSADPLNNAQEVGSILGKILRISPASVGSAPYGVPADNPFVGHAGARWEIWMYGLQNPWRFSFDRDGTMWIGDPGQDKYDEVDVASPGHAAGANWGWSLREGKHPLKGSAPAGARDPLIELPHVNASCSVIGGYVYRGAAIPALQGAYVHGDACSPDVVATVVADGKVQSDHTLGQVRGVTSFGQAPNGDLYVVSYAGTVARLDAVAG